MLRHIHDNHWVRHVKLKPQLGMKSVVDWRDRWHRTPLSWAVQNDNISAVKLLVLELGADVHARVRAGAAKKSSPLVHESPQELGVRLGTYDLERLLMRVDADDGDGDGEGDGA